MSANRVLYLSAAPRVSLRSDTQLPGARSHILGVCNGFERLGFDVDTWIVGDLRPLDSGSSVEGRLADSRLLRVAADARRMGLDRTNRRRVHAALEPRPSLVYERYATFQAAGVAARKQGIPWVLEVNGAMWAESRHDRRSIELVRLARRQQVAAMRAADLVVTVSEPLREVLIDAGGPSDMIVMPNGVDTEAFHPDGHATRLFPHPTVVVGFAGVAFGWQGLPRLVEAVSQLRQQGHDLAVAIVGDGPDRGRIEATIAAHQAEGFVTITGFVDPDDVPAYVRGFDIGYCGHETLSSGTMYHSPLKLYEYLATGLAVLSTDFAEARVLVEGAETGTVVGSGEHLATGLESLIQTDARLAAGRRARSVAVGQCSWETRVVELVRVLQARNLLCGPQQDFPSGQPGLARRQMPSSADFDSEETKTTS